MDPVEFLRFAQGIIRDSGNVGAVQCRVAISRAYYAAFNVAMDLLGGAGFTVPRFNSPSENEGSPSSGLPRKLPGKHRAPAAAVRP